MTGQNGLRAALYHRLHWLWPLVYNRRLRGLWRALVWSFLLVYFGFVTLVLALRYSILPHIEDYRPAIERLASQALGQPISIGRIEASWAGINPDLTLLDVRVADGDGRPALAFSRIEAVLSWWTVPSAQLKLRLLRIDQPTLNLRRAGDGSIFIAGIPLTRQSNDSDVSDWILAQRRIRISGATLVWNDELRQAPALVLDQLDLALDNDGSRHRFGLTAQPPAALASAIDVRGDFRGSAIEAMESWSGQAYAQIAYADLAIWRQWVDYPIALPQGRGALRAWLGFAQGGLREVTADVALQDVSLGLAKDLPELELEQLSGRLAARFTASGFELTGRRIELTTRPLAARDVREAEAIRLEPNDFHVEYRPPAHGQRGTGSASASQLDVGALARLAAYLPVDAQLRQRLVDYSPQGKVSALSAKWKGDGERLETYSFKTSFDRLALRAQGAVPGFSGLSGTLEASEAGGAATLQSKDLTIDVPSVFPEPRTALDTLAAQVKWKLVPSGVEAELSHAEFAGPDAAGSAQGRYHSAADSAGVIDLTAALTRADARAVWRYMPHAVGKGARLWLRDSLLAGRASEAKLILKGNLNDFPFLDKRKGQFLVTVKAHDTVIDYAKGWPRIEAIAGDLRFEGNGMVVDAHRGTILGAQLSHTRVEIPDFEAPISTLIVKGQAQGPTSEFLKFIEQSPVAERIDHFTDDLSASGLGHLDIGLTIPLDEAKLGNSKIDGTYRLINNEVTVDTALPPIRQVNGSVQFSGSDLKVPEINGTLFGGPLKIKGGLQKDGKVLITANGSVSVAQLRKVADSPLLDKLSGATSYRGEVHINKRNADLVIDSTLAGLASTLPEPFAKAAGDTLALHFEKRLLPTTNGEVRDQLSATLGSALSLQLIRRKGSEGFASERGAIGVGRVQPLPAAGIALGVSAKRLDLDLWRRVLESASAGASSAVDAVSIKADDLLLLGRHFSAVDLAAALTPEQWTIRLASRQASGNLIWDSAGSGKLTARFKQISVDPATPETGEVAREAVEKLPALDVVADEFTLGVRRFGRLELQARNEGGLWHLSKIQMSNPFGDLAGSGQWQVAGGRNRTQLDFKIDSSDVGKLLERLGYPGTVRAGTALLGGKIGWNGSPADLDFESLSGEMSLEAAKGQFVKLDPGAAGKLLGLISLQGLPRRISLDFKDVFSDGLAFDSINSKVTVKSGVMRTDRLLIDGPSARVVMRGEVDLKRETQRLSVNVQPELGSTAAIGVALINPLAGVATLLAHKVLQNPLNQMFGFDYLVTGSWDDPKVEKISSAGAEVAVPRLPTITPGAHSEPSAK